MRGQHLTVRMGTDLDTRKMTPSFQPEALPHAQPVTFIGNQALSSNELGAVLNKLAASAE